MAAPEVPLRDGRCRRKLRGEGPIPSAAPVACASRTVCFALARPPQRSVASTATCGCLLYTSDAADDM
eukprot:13111195-Alexandrium_andersonii.AAC.1